MKTPKNLIPLLLILFCQCKSPSEQYAERPKVKFTRTHNWQNGEHTIKSQYFAYGDNNLVNKITTIDSISESAGLVGVKWVSFKNVQIISYNRTNNIDAIKNVNDKGITIEKYHYENEALSFKTLTNSKTIDTTHYKYDGDRVICSYKRKELLYKDYSNDGTLDSTYVSNGKYIIGKFFYYYSDTTDYSKVPLALGNKLYDPSRALVKINSRTTNGVSEDKIRYEFDEKLRPIKIIVNNCSDYMITKVGYID